MTRLPIVYIAGKFRAPTAAGLAANVREAKHWGLRVAELGAMPLIPHANTGSFYGLLTEQFWLDGTLSQLAKCDAALFIPGWIDSQGACAEHSFCERYAIPLFGAAEVRCGQFAAWVQEWRERQASDAAALRRLSDATGCPEAIERAYALGARAHEWLLAKHSFDDVDPRIVAAADAVLRRKEAAQP
jgi:hypothetical protein